MCEMAAVAALLLSVLYRIEGLWGHAEVAEHHLHCPFHPGMYPKDHRFWAAGEKHSNTHSTVSGFWSALLLTNQEVKSSLIKKKKISEVQAWKSFRHQRPHSEFSYVGLKYRKSVFSIQTSGINTDLRAIQTIARKWSLSRRQACLG